MARRILTLTATAGLLSVASAPALAVDQARDAALFAACADFYAEEGQTDKAATMRQAQNAAMAEAGLSQVKPAPIRQTAPHVANDPFLAQLAKGSTTSTCGAAEITAMNFYTSDLVKRGDSFSRGDQIEKALERSYPNETPRTPNQMKEYILRGTVEP
ncbi:hypothetical protein [Marinivivus vitaminiproducens]|uniref:hypothetical protein n=1 Tax=Marinivivus vitaminiproducens TaxID=3035935 RepID=UPI002798F962|nr:hypothetical protein P4R82_24600 [Geminicoccaceae bacterium SCSIO 64248]